MSDNLTLRVTLTNLPLKLEWHMSITASAARARWAWVLLTNNQAYGTRTRPKPQGSCMGTDCGRLGPSWPVALTFCGNEKLGFKLLPVEGRGGEVWTTTNYCSWIYQCVSFLVPDIRATPDFFCSSYNRDKTRFLKDYPEGNTSFSALLKAIRTQRQENGECQIRRKKSN